MLSRNMGINYRAMHAIKVNTTTDGNYLPVLELVHQYSAPYLSAN